MRLSWRYCVCGHVVTQHSLTMGGIPYRALPWCSANLDCLCPKFHDRSVWQLVRWTVWRWFGI